MPIDSERLESVLTDDSNNDRGILLASALSRCGKPLEGHAKDELGVVVPEILSQ